MSLSTPAGNNYVGVLDSAAATTGYVQKRGLRRVDVELDDGEDCVAPGFEKDEYAFCLGPTGRPTDKLTPMLSSSRLKKAREFLISGGVNVNQIQQDRQGTHYFERHDSEGTVIEITEEL
jgi:hypothetical protein